MFSDDASDQAVRQGLRVLSRTSDRVVHSRSGVRGPNRGAPTTGASSRAQICDGLRLIDHDVVKRRLDDGELGVQSAGETTLPRHP